MSRFKNDRGDVLFVNDLGRNAGPYEEFDWPGHDLEVHGLPTGCTWLDAPEEKAPKGDSAGSADDKPAPKRKAADKDKENGE